MHLLVEFRTCAEPHMLQSALSTWTIWTTSMWMIWYCEESLTLRARNKRRTKWSGILLWRINYQSNRIRLVWILRIRSVLRSSLTKENRFDYSSWLTNANQSCMGNLLANFIRMMEFVTTRCLRAVILTSE